MHKLEFDDQQALHALICRRGVHRGWFLPWRVSLFFVPFLTFRRRKASSICVQVRWVTGIDRRLAKGLMGGKTKRVAFKEFRSVVLIHMRS